MSNRMKSLLLFLAAACPAVVSGCGEQTTIGNTGFGGGLTMNEQGLWVSRDPPAPTASLSDVEKKRRAIKALEEYKKRQLSGSWQSGT